MRAFTEILLGITLQDALRYSLVVLGLSCAVYVIIYGVQRISETQSIAFIVSGFMSLFTINRMYKYW